MSVISIDCASTGTWGKTIHGSINSPMLTSAKTLGWIRPNSNI